MAQAYDMLENVDSKDLIIEDNDMVYGLSDEQHISDTIIAAPFWWKQFPTDGVDIYQYLASSGQQQKIIAKIKQQLNIDGYNTNNATVTTSTNGDLKIIPNAYRI